MRGKGIAEFEKEHGGSRVAELEKQLQYAVPRKPLVVDVPDEKNTIAFGVCGDRHVGSLFAAYDTYEAYRARLKAEGITLLLDAGDILDGHRIYKGHEFEVADLGYAAQRRRLKDVEPKDSRLVVKFITGNHDLSLKKLAGVDVGDGISESLSGYQHIGEDQGTVVLRTSSGREYVVKLLHPGGGSSYAISYRPQKIVESMEGGTKPNMICIGHYHKSDFLPSYRNVACLQTGTFQWQTPFMSGKGLAAHVGGWIVRVTVGDKKSQSNSVSAEFVAFYR
jgi:hypothetical protein